MRATLASVRCWSAIPIAIQLAHAGRKACTEVPWKGGEQLPPGDPCGWQAQAPSPLSFAPEENTPDQLSKQRMNELKDAFAAAARRADGLADQLTAEHGGRFVSAPPGSSRGGQAVRCSRGKRLGSRIQQCHFCCCRSAGVLDRDPPARCQSDQAQWQLHDRGGCRRDDPCGEGQCYAQQTSRGSDWNIIWGAGVPKLRRDPSRTAIQARWLRGSTWPQRHGLSRCRRDGPTGYYATTRDRARSPSSSYRAEWRGHRLGCCRTCGAKGRGN